jgi:hypothetical protein
VRLSCVLQCDHSHQLQVWSPICSLLSQKKEKYGPRRRDRDYRGKALWHTMNRVFPKSCTIALLCPSPLPHPQGQETVSCPHSSPEDINIVFGQQHRVNAVARRGVTHEHISKHTHSCVDTVAGLKHHQGQAVCLSQLWVSSLSVPLGFLLAFLPLPLFLKPLHTAGKLQGYVHNTQVTSKPLHTATFTELWLNYLICLLHR